MRTESLIDFKADRRTIQKSALNSIIIQIIFKLKGFITIPIITYYLAPKDFGIFNLISVTASLLTPIFFMNLADGPIVYLVQEKSKKQIQDMYNTVINGSLLFFAFWSIIFLFFISHYSGEKYRYLYFVLPMIFSAIFYKLFCYIFAVFQKTTILIKNTLFKDSLETVLSILLVILGFSYKGIIFAGIISQVMAGARIYYRYGRWELPLRFYINKSILLKFLKISLPLLPVFFFSWVIHSSDYYFLLYYKGENSVGKYSLIYGLCNMILILTWALNFFWFPLSARLWVEDREKYRKFFIKVFTVFSAVLMMAVLLFEFNSKIIMQFFARRPEYRDAYGIMGIIAFAFALQVLVSLLTAPLYSNKNTFQIFLSFFISGLMNFILNFLLIPSHGIWGAAISTALSYGAIVFLMSYFNYHLAQFAFFEKRLFYMATVFILMWIGVVFVRNHVNLFVLLLINIFLCLSGVSLIYFKVLNKGEKEFFYSIFKDLKLKFTPGIEN